MIASASAEQSPVPSWLSDKSNCVIVELSLIASAITVQSPVPSPFPNKFNCVIAGLSLIAAASAVQSSVPRLLSDKSNSVVVELSLIASASALQSPVTSSLHEICNTVIEELCLITSANAEHSIIPGKSSDKFSSAILRFLPRERDNNTRREELASFLHSPMHCNAKNNKSLLFTWSAILAIKGFTFSWDCEANRPHVNKSTWWSSRKYLVSVIMFSGQISLFRTWPQR